MAIPDYIAQLLNKDLYGAGNKEINLIQTHISYVIITDNFVYKIKKPVQFSFLDFSTLDKRKKYCYKEVELNKRLSPDIYLGVLEIKKFNNKFNYGKTGDTIDYCVKMKRIPEDKMMINLIKNNKITKEHIQKTASLIANFHKKAKSNQEISKFGSLESIHKNINGNYEYAEKYIGKTLSKETFNKIKNYSDLFLKENQDLFIKRINTGKIKDCHGDIHMEHVCIDEKIYIYDCIEFNERFRYCDVISEIAFLAMDLDFHQRSDLSKLFVNYYKEFSKDNDIEKLLNFYKCYRACVRGKVDSFEIDDENLSSIEKEKAKNLAAKYFRLAESYV
ncbi:MAG: gluconokinase [Spirochaetia bacterium]|nr:gluconokinase [Spirochaetia bacterium]